MGRLTTKGEIIDVFREHNEEKGYKYGSNAKNDMSAVIVFDKCNWDREYTEEERSYRVTNVSGKMFFSGMLGTSMVGDCLDGKDIGVRLDYYTDWKIERCYFEDRND